MLSIRLGSAQIMLLTPDPKSALVQTNNSGGIIVLGVFGGLFALVTIAITIGVLRAHRDPEQYGPQPARPGRPKQSRAKGLARAVLESIPVVKFGENNDKDANAAARRDIELAVTGPDNQSTTVNANNPSDPDVKSDISTNTPATTTEGLSAAQPTFQTRYGSLECSICLEDFFKNEEIRILPCNHTFHPACIDPWLLNVLGTCPIW